MNRIDTTAGPLYQAEVLTGIEWLEHGFGTRGVLLQSYLNHFGKTSLLRTNQKHGNRVHILDEVPPKVLLEGDAFVTNSKGVVCFVRTADCVPILLCDRKNRAVGAVHAGWRGHVCDVVGNTVRTMGEVFGSDPSNLLAAIGPSICADCYTVGEEVVESFSQKGFNGGIWTGAPNRNEYKLDLRKATRELLIQSGVNRESIGATDLCTFCERSDFASYRRERAEKSRQVNFVYIK